MMIRVQAVYFDGVLQLEKPLPIPDGTRVSVEIQLTPIGTSVHLRKPTSAEPHVTAPLAGVIGIGD
ncbi:hypothetical protein [Lacipirellula sp.]|uniref:hypothetical protein n=1 Tax=Lacipirellula sp. TaxID=2691419 RepID=UPI003D0F9A50